MTVFNPEETDVLFQESIVNPAEFNLNLFCFCKFSKMMVSGPDLSEGINTPPVMIFINEQHEYIKKAYVVFSPVVFNLFSQIVNSRAQSNCLGFQVNFHHFIGEGLQVPVHSFAPSC